MTDRHPVEPYDDCELDQLLDRALASYADQEPVASLPTRIFARMHEAVPQRQRMWRIGFLAPAACVAALLLAFLLHPANRAPDNRAANAPAVATASAPPAPSANLGHTLAPAARPRVVAATRRSHDRDKAISPRRSVSLASAPLTEEEAMLLRFAQQHPEQAREVLSPPPSGPIQNDPVVIAPIQIAGLSDSRPNSH